LVEEAVATALVKEAEGAELVSVDIMRIQLLGPMHQLCEWGQQVAGAHRFRGSCSMSYRGQYMHHFRAYIQYLR